MRELLTSLCFVIYNKLIFLTIILLDVLKPLNVVNAHQAILGMLKLINVNQFALLANIGILKMQHVKIVCLIALGKTKI